MSTQVLLPAAEAGLTAAQFARVREWVYRRTGMQFADSKRYFVDKRVQSCVRAHGGSFDAWYAALRLGADPALGQQLINELTVNETYFLREDHQLDALVRTVLPAVAAQRRAERSRDPIRLLSLPCSTGEEPYSMALRLLEEWEDIAHFDVEVVAGDIDTRALAHARTGEYGERSMSRVPPALRSRHFERLPDSAAGQRWRISADLREAIAFSSVNICDPASVRALGAFDVAFCRNLLIYFDAVSMRQAAENLFAALRPGGHLFLGHSESMSRITPVFTPVRLPEGIAYQRPPIGGQR